MKQGDKVQLKSSVAEKDLVDYGIPLSDATSIIKARIGIVDSVVDDWSSLNIDGIDTIWSYRNEWLEPVPGYTPGGVSRTVPDIASVRKSQPVASGVLAYFPLALKAIAHCSYVGNEQHNPGQSLHWDRSKSTDEDDAMIRHYLDSLGPNKVDDDGVLHSTKCAWRALARLEKELEACKGPTMNYDMI